MSLPFGFSSLRTCSLPWAAALVGGLVAGPAPVRAQSAFLLEVRTGVAIPTGSFTTGPEGGRLAQAPSVDVQFGLRTGGHTYLYLGFAQARIDCTRDGCGRRWVSTQWNAGARVEWTSGPVAPWIRAGVVSPTVEHVPVPAGQPGPLTRGISERGWGGEAGAGVRFALNDRLSVSPGARFVAVDVGRTGGADIRMRYVVVDLGLVVGF